MDHYQICHQGVLDRRIWQNQWQPPAPIAEVPEIFSIKLYHHQIVQIQNIGQD